MKNTVITVFFFDRLKFSNTLIYVYKQRRTGVPAQKCIGQRDMKVNNLFIIPNSATKATEYRDLDWKSGRLFKQTGIEIRPDDTLVQVSVKGWDRFGSFQESLGVEFSDEPTDENRQVGYFAEYWPLRILDGHKEGDEITLTSPEYGQTYKLRLEQRSSKYRKISATVLMGGSKQGAKLGIAYLGEFNFERALDFVLGRGEFAS